MYIMLHNTGGGRGSGVEGWGGGGVSGRSKVKLVGGRVEWVRGGWVEGVEV